MKTYKVTASRWEGGWELDIQGVGVTQSHGLADADEMIRDYLVLDLGGSPADYDYELTYDLDGLGEEATQLRADVSDLLERQTVVAARSRHLAQQLRQVGLTGADTAVVLGVSPQRVSQLLKSAR